MKIECQKQKIKMTFQYKLKKHNLEWPDKVRMIKPSRSPGILNNWQGGKFHETCIVVSKFIIKIWKYYYKNLRKFFAFEISAIVLLFQKNNMVFRGIVITLPKMIAQTTNFETMTIINDVITHIINEYFSWNKQI